MKLRSYKKVANLALHQLRAKERPLLVRTAVNISLQR
jgi:hypothetical protein